MGYDLRRVRDPQIGGSWLSNGYEVIRSRENPKIKYFASMHDRKKASKEGVVFIEGSRLCEDALLSGIRPIKTIVTEARYELFGKLKDEFDIGTEVTVTTEELFAKIASTVNPQGIAMIVDEPESVKELPGRDDGKDIYVVLENVQDPGNMGTIIRMADAFDLNAVILTNGCVDPYNEKVLRSSMGSVWHIPMIRGFSSGQVIDMLRENNVSCMAADLKGDTLDTSVIELPAAYFIGNEGSGLKDSTSVACDKKVKIPMPGKAESLNAASAASIIGFVLSSKRLQQ